MTIYLCLIFFALIFLAFFAEWAIIKLAYKKQLFDKPNERKIHSANIPRLGGFVIFPVVLFGLLLMWNIDCRSFNLLFSKFRLELLAVIAAVTVVYICGTVDDLVGIRYRKKFIAQILSGMALCTCGLVIDNLHGFMGIGQLPNFLAWVLTVLTVVYVSNAFNFIDGIDGLAGSLSVVALCCYIGLFYCFGMMGFAVLCGFVIVALVALLTFNLFGKPGKSKVFMGDAGSLSLGVFLCACGILTLQNAESSELPANNPFVLATMPLLLPCFDVVRVVLYRLMHGSNIFTADKSHIHHILLGLGLSQNRVLCVLLVIDILMILCAIALPYLGVNVMMMIEIVIFTLIIFVINSKLKSEEL